MQYNAIEGFDDPNGKFPNTLGNVALIDCHYVLSSIEENIKGMFDRIEEISPFIYTAIQPMKARFQGIFDNITMCEYALQIEGLLDHAAKYYMGNEETMEH